MDIESTVSLFRGHILAQTEIPRGIGTHWKQEPVTLEDALGFLYPIPLELVNSWDVCITLIPLLGDLTESLVPSYNSHPEI